MHEVVSGLHDWQQLDQEEASLNEQFERLLAYRARVRGEYEQAAQQWNRDFEAAIREGRDPPPKPPAPDLEPPLGQQIQQQRVQLVDRRVQVLRSNRRLILERARDRAAELISEARKTPVGEVGPIAVELSELAFALRQALGDGGQFEMDVTSLDVCAAVVAGLDPLFKPGAGPNISAELEKLHEPSSRVMVDTDRTQTVAEVRQLVQSRRARMIADEQQNRPLLDSG